MQKAQAFRTFQRAFQTFLASVAKRRNLRKLGLTSFLTVGAGYQLFSSQSLASKASFSTGSQSSEGTFSSAYQSLKNKTLVLLSPDGHCLGNGYATSNGYCLLLVDSPGETFLTDQKEPKPILPPKLAALIDKVKKGNALLTSQETLCNLGFDSSPVSEDANLKYRFIQYDEKTRILVLKIDQSSNHDRALSVAKEDPKTGDRIYLSGVDKAGDSTLDELLTVNSWAKSFTPPFSNQKDTSLVPEVLSFRTNYKSSAASKNDLVSKLAFNSSGDLVGLCQASCPSICYAASHLRHFESSLSKKGKLEPSKLGGSVKTSSDKDGKIRLI